LRQRVGIVAARPGALADLRVAEVGEVGVVELQVAAAARGQVGDLRPVGGGEDCVEVLQVRVDIFRYRPAAAADVQHGGRRAGDLQPLCPPAAARVVTGA